LERDGLLHAGILYLSAQNLSDGLYDRVLFKIASGYLRQQSREKEIVPGREEDNVILVSAEAFATSSETCTMCVEALLHVHPSWPLLYCYPISLGKSLTILTAPQPDPKMTTRGFCDPLSNFRVCCCWASVPLFGTAGAANTCVLCTSQTAGSRTFLCLTQLGCDRRVDSQRAVACLSS